MYQTNLLLSIYTCFFVYVSFVMFYPNFNWNSSLFIKLQSIKSILVFVIKLSLAELPLISKSFRFESVDSLVLFFLNVLSTILSSIFYDPATLYSFPKISWFKKSMQYLRNKVKIKNISVGYLLEKY